MPPRTAQPSSNPSAGTSPAPGRRGQGDGTYQVLARRYRSREFGEVVGQEIIAKTLQNAIILGRTAHAYLFTGTRGVGKTSMARIFARALNAPVAAGDGAEALLPRAASVDAILVGQDIDVIEIDGASNRGVDDARSLISGAGITPTRSPYKIYIIDEVHMLTTPAFNALLKTMEEPPEHVKFILCTTEAHKVPATIQSRCQRFDFKSIPMARIQAHLSSVLESEGISWEPEALSEVSRLANGSMRDGLSLLERLIAAARGTITTGIAREVLGLPDAHRLDDMLRAVATADSSGALRAASAMLDTGVSVEHLLELLADRFRLAMVAATCGLDGLPEDLSREHCLGAFEAASGMAVEDLVHAVALCDSTSRTTRSSSIPRAVLDALLVRLALSERFASSSGEPASATTVAQKKKVEPTTAPATALAAVTATVTLPRAPVSGAVLPPPPPAINQQEAVAEAARDPVIQDLMSVLDATVLRVEPLEGVVHASVDTDASDEGEE
ncbi:MAG: DNA polymerase III subunit gamma/tau [Planctomycetota bacterium]|nr:DNA polymerase III subunit gamma/tau [Planctomycetota bacterium]MDA1105733.1 DNA polymerase III subunit gamma/tau [Planctomycetota bacterium]